MRTLSSTVLVALALVALAACDRHGAASSAKPAPVAVASFAVASSAPSVASPTSAPDDAVLVPVRDVLVAAHGLGDVEMAATRVWTTKSGERVMEWALSATHVATGRRVGVGGVSVGARIYADDATIRAQIGQSHAKVRPLPLLPLHAERYEVAGTPRERRNLAAVVAMRDALVARDEAAFLALLTDDVVEDDMSQPDSSRGKKDARRFFAHLPKDATFELHDTWAVGDWAIAETTQSGTKVLSIWRFVDGRVREGWTYPAYRSSIAAPARGGPNQ